MLLTWTVESREEVIIWNSYKNHVYFLRLNLCEEQNIEIESIFAEALLLLAELHPNRRRWLRRCDTSLQVHLDAQTFLTTTCWVSLSTFLTATNRSNQIASTVSQGGVRVKILPIYYHLVPWLHHLAHFYVIFSILRTLMQFHCNLLYTHSPNAMIQEYIWIKELDILKSCTIIFTFYRIAAFFSPFYDWRCSKFLRCTEFWSGIEEKGISDLQFSAWIVVTIKLLTLTNFPSLWHYFFLNMS